ncbi:MAG: DUF1206 domain-containing protein [Streptococcaceae bacterium]|jgi:hypothetical protein|nr:DUF1206 domain-containing protein [Streptococcaceae bacterium]
MAIFGVTEDNNKKSRGELLMRREEIIAQLNELDRELSEIDILIAKKPQKRFLFGRVLLVLFGLALIAFGIFYLVTGL